MKPAGSVSPPEIKALRAGRCYNVAMFRSRSAPWRFFALFALLLALPLRALAGVGALPACAHGDPVGIAAPCDHAGGGHHAAAPAPADEGGAADHGAPCCVHPAVPLALPAVAGPGVAGEAPPAALSPRFRSAELPGWERPPRG